MNKGLNRGTDTGTDTGTDSAKPAYLSHKNALLTAKYPPPPAAAARKKGKVRQCPVICPISGPSPFPPFRRHIAKVERGT